MWTWFIAILFSCIILGSPTTAGSTVIPKWFGIDLDGTFYTKKEESLKENIDAFKRAKDAGYNLFFCTGGLPRAVVRFSALQFVEKTGYNGYPGVYANGAVVVDEYRNLIDPIYFPTSFLEKLLQFIQDKNYEKQFFFISDERIVGLDEPSPVLDIFNVTDDGRLYESIVVTREELQQLEIPIIYVDVSVDMEAFKSYGYELDVVIIRGRYCYDIMPPGVNKASGIVKLSKHFGINPKDVGFIGDGINDIEAMELSKYSYAVGNALPQVKQAAKHILNETCDQAAFAKAMSLVYGV